MDIEERTLYRLGTENVSGLKNVSLTLREFSHKRKKLQPLRRPLSSSSSLSKTQTHSLFWEAMDNPASWPPPVGPGPQPRRSGPHPPPARPRPPPPPPPSPPPPPAPRRRRPSRPRRVAAGALDGVSAAWDLPLYWTGEGLAGLAPRLGARPEPAGALPARAPGRAAGGGTGADRGGKGPRGDSSKWP